MRHDIMVFADLGGKVRSGPVKFGRDWPGTYIEGIRSLGYAAALDKLLSLVDLKALATHQGILQTIDELHALLAQCQVAENPMERPPATAYAVRQRQKRQTH